MRFFRAFVVVVVLVVVAFNGFAVDPTEIVTKQKAVDNKFVRKAERPSNGREDLQLPAPLVEMIKSNIRFADRKLGYTEEEMDYYKGSKYILPVVERLFRDATTIPTWTGKLADRFVENSSSAYTVSSYGFTMLGTRVGRGIEPSTQKYQWSVEGISNGTFPIDALKDMCELHNISLNYRDVKKLKSLPKEVQVYIVRVIAAYMMAENSIAKAYDKEYLEKTFKVENWNDIDRQELYRLAISPWSHDEASPEAFKMINTIDFAYLGLGASLFLSHIDLANRDISQWLSRNPLQTEFKEISFNSPMGKVFIGGTGNNEIKGNKYSLIIDLGGDDIYRGSVGTPLDFQHCIGFVADLSGNDTYQTDQPATMVCGLFGIGALFDFKGNDKYYTVENGLGSALYGFSIMQDFRGNDIYKTEKKWTEGSAHVGVGILVDLLGDDFYYAGAQSQAFGSTLGVGLLIDVAGSDRYRASDSKDYFSDSFNQIVSFCQGTAFGRRADFGDGHSFAGGIGMLVEGGGDDTYYSHVYSQGAGYWWGLGVLEDLGGNDTYRATWYSLGSAPHFAIGSFVDLTGDDEYNLGNGDAQCQYHGCARDGSIGIAIDGDGDDKYLFKNRCGGAGDLNSIAIFWDRWGNDVYDTVLTSSYVNDPPMGNSAFYDKFRSFRDHVPTVGIFIDTDGVDQYLIDPKANNSRKVLSKENFQWWQNQGPTFWGYGIDINWYKLPK